MEEAPIIKINFGRYLKPSEAPCSFCGVDIPGKAGFLLKILNLTANTLNEFHLCTKCLEHSRQYEAEVDLSANNPQHSLKLGF
jgi:hypothetical protein